MITYLRAYPIDAWDEKTTTGAVAALATASNLRLSPVSAASVHTKLGLGVPYHVQLLMDEVRRDADRRSDRHVSLDDIERVYQGPFLTSAVRAHLLHLEARLSTVLGEGDELRLARDLLTQAAVVGLLEPGDAAWLAEELVEDESQRVGILREVLEILEHDAYFDRGPKGWQFRSRLVQDWWRRGNELCFVPVAERRYRP